MAQNLPQHEEAEEGEEEELAVAEEYELLPQLIAQSVKIFLGWKETKEKVDDWNPFKERKVAEFWANHAKEQKKKKSKLKIEAPTTTGTVKEKLKGYKIPKKKKSSNAKLNKPQN
ncbi:hypothetical protein PGTUg99_018441 [Puccinia graminis f. sp. tritici]|uniref:Uncharacterized protein n=1 Tax=Puccinia graminis f. sp. tritici TaxID=56615 RepID=A0A5B0MB97_PUCGR|nr:hypothetical protein PGTUg99_018441 [Puccinia graminis f. sp. tritici]